MLIVIYYPKLEDSHGHQDSAKCQPSVKSGPIPGHRHLSLETGEIVLFSLSTYEDY